MNQQMRLQLTGVSKHFGPTQALDSVELSLSRGEVHAIVGENGAGKSTLVKIVSGSERADSGTMLLDGKPFAPPSPLEAQKHGVVMVHQELTLAPDLTVEENVLLGRESRLFGFLRKGKDRERVRNALQLLEHADIDLQAPVSAITPATGQLVEIARALLTDVRLIILDEPTSALSSEDSARLFDVVRKLQSQGVGILYISHFLEEIEAIADRITVLRDGRSVLTGKVNEVPQDRMIEAMVGRALGEQYPRTSHELGNTVLEIDSLQGVDLPRGATLRLRQGEILGIAGIVGAGRTELLRAFFGLDEVKAGKIRIGVYSGAASPRRRIRQGVGMLSEDRKLEGLALDQSIADNLTYSSLNRFGVFGLLRLGKRSAAVAKQLDSLRVRFRDEGQPIGELSGGNQQKVALGRLLIQEADVLLLDEPTRGVDVGSKVEIYQQIGELARNGKAILVVGNYLPELLGICDTLAVMSRGKLGPIKPIAEWNQEEIMRAATV